MGYSAADDERFTHQLPRPFDTMHSPDGSWSDRCYFFVHSPDGSLLVTSGYGNNTNQGTSHCYGKLALGDGRHWDLTAGRAITPSDQHELAAGPMRWTCVEPLKRWRIELGPNASGIEWDMEYRPRTPMWELLPMHIEVDGQVVLDMYHIKQSGTYTGWVQIDGERISLDGFEGGRDRTFGVRVADQLDFWLWLDIGFEDRAIQAWVIESHDGTVQYVDGGITHVDGTLSKRFVKIDHEIEFDGALKRPMKTALVFTDEDGIEHRVTGASTHPAVAAYYGLPLPKMDLEDLGNGEYFFHFPWDSNDRDELVAFEAGALSIDQLMRFDYDGRSGFGIFETLTGGKSLARYPNWPPMDMSKFRQPARTPEQ